MKLGLKFFLIIIVLLLFRFSMKKSFKHNEMLINYKLSTSGAGESLDQWSYERCYPEDKIYIENYFEAFIESQRNQLYSRGPDENCWESIGPENIGGRILCLAFHPSDPNIIYAGSASGGLWKTTTMGLGRNAWEHIPTGFPVLGVASIAIDKNDPDIIYLGTGEVYHNFGLAEPGTINRFTRGTYGIGILKTIDGGKSWTQTLSFPQSGLVGVSDLEINKNNSSEVYAATTLGTYQTLNSGLDWELIHPVGPAIDIELDPDNEEVIYISQGNLNTGLNPALSGIFKSTDKGNSFSKLTDDGLLPAWSGKAKLSLDPSNSNIVYASIQVGWPNNGPTTPAGLYRSLDSGTNWSQINNTNISFWQGWYSHDVAINPKNPQELMYVGISAWKSTDGGSTFTLKSDDSNWAFGKIPVDFPEGDSTFIHDDIHAVYYHPLDNNKVFFAGDGGVHMSTDRGESYITLNGGLQTTQFYPDFTSSPLDPNLAIGGTQDNSTYIYDGSASWSRVIGGDGMSTAINFENDSILYGSAQGLFLAKSVDKGNNFIPISPPTAANEISAFNGPFLLAPNDPRTIFAGRQFLYKSTDAGNTWTTTSNTQVDGPNNAIVDIAISHQDPNKILVATSPNPFSDISSAKLLMSNNGGVTWINLSSSFPNRIIKDIAFDPQNDQQIYVVFSGFNSAHLAISSDSGDTWELINSLPDVPTQSIVIDPLNTQHIYVGNDLGVYFSDDSGITWQMLSHGLPDATLAIDLSYSAANRKIRVATHGRGVYERNLVFDAFTSSTIESESSIEFAVYPNPFNEEINIRISSDFSFKGLFQIRNLSGKVIKSSSEQIGEGRNEYALNVSSLPSGTYFVVVQNANRILSKKVLKL